jgi:mono/diheme cytochrome c family protein
VTRGILPVLLACGATVSACGSSGGGHASASASSGRVLFGQACGACHSLTGHDDPRHQGGDLLGFHASRAQLSQLASEMPVRRPLNRAQLRAVVSFVMSAEETR